MVKLEDKLVVPPPVKRGDKVILIAPAGFPEVQLIVAGSNVLRSWGLEPVVHPQCLDTSFGYLAGRDESRLRGLVEAFEDPTITAVICARGGYGCTRLLNSLSSSSLTPAALASKRFFGFSDITALHRWMQVRVPGIVTFHSPLPATSLFINGSDNSRESLRRALFESRLSSMCPPLKGRCLQMGNAAGRGGRIEGRLVGGNLSLLASLAGTPWQQSLDEGCILLLEDVNEAAYRVDRMMEQLIAASGGANSLQRLAGIVIGDFTELLDSDNAKGYGVDVENGVAVNEWLWLKQIGLPPTLPILDGLQIGHVLDNRTVPLGARVVMDMNNSTLQILDA